MAEDREGEGNRSDWKTGGLFIPRQISSRDDKTGRGEWGNTKQMISLWKYGLWSWGDVWK